MSDCESYETSLSALADGELPTEDLLPTLDHLAECASCQAFYRDVRALAAAIPANANAADIADIADNSRRLAASAPAQAPEEIWRRIEAAASPALSRTGRSRPWAMRLAAALLLVASLWGALAAVRSTMRPAGEPIEITLGEDSGRMTEQRFLALTVELLRADSRYHLEMLQVLTAVFEQGRRQEAPVDYDAPLPEGDDGESNDWRPAQGARRLS
ncbi:MAG TPA: zf-HC2 domain-containing protein [Thermoanaerobaculia bacterium]|nr:zf-HC2 domain-containing protein [Thermoanaerobaculia bacterium]